MNTKGLMTTAIETNKIINIILSLLIKSPSDM